MGSIRVELTEEDHRELRIICAKSGRTHSELVTAWILEHADRDERPNDAA